MTDIIKPMLATSIKDYSKLRFPKLASTKLDGIRCIIHNGVAYSRSGKPIRSSTVQSLFGKPELNGLDGELIYGDPCAENAFSVTTSAVMSDTLPEGFKTSLLRFHVFDYIPLAKGFKDRLQEALIVSHGHPQVEFVTHIQLNSMEELQEFENRVLAEGYEGVMLRNLEGGYKHGRATEASQDLLKVKRFVDAEARVIGFIELMHNGNEAQINELGYMEHSSHKENLVGMNTLGALMCKNDKGEEFRIGTGFSAEKRKEIWEHRESYLGKLAKYKSFPIGVKDAPRLPVFLAFRDEDDMS